ncbi:cytochrome c oxidase, partial [Ramicandelaber brevisporus]
GPGTADSNHIPSNFDQATGLERYEMMAELEGRKPWDIDPIVPAKIGTAKEPIVVESVDDFRLIGCSGFPAESHDLIWIRVQQQKDVDRCPECGCAFQLKYVGEEHAHHH